MSNASTIFSGVKTVVQSALGSEYSELTHTMNLEKNTFSGASKRWGILPSGGFEERGNTQNNTVSQGFKVILTDDYITSECGDSEVIGKVVSMIGLLESVFKALVKQKCGAPTAVILVNGFSIDETLVWEDEKIIVIEANFQVRHQVSLI